MILLFMSNLNKENPRAFYWKEGGVNLVSRKPFSGEGLDILKYILAAFVVPKSWLESVSYTRLNASWNIALRAFPG